MRLDIRNALKNPGQSYPLSRELSLPPMDVLDDVISFDQIQLVGDFVGAEESVRIEGDVTAIVHAHCALCLEPLEAKIQTHVNEVFATQPDPNDPDQYPLDGYGIELAELVKDALLLELPMRFVCGEDCKGLCPLCGANRNTQRCTCH